MLNDSLGVKKVRADQKRRDGKGRKRVKSDFISRVEEKNMNNWRGERRMLESGQVEGEKHELHQS